MSETGPASREARFVLSAPPPVRALAIASAAAVVGAATVVAWGALTWPVGLAVLGVVLIVLGVALAVAALVLTRRLRTAVQTDDEHIAVTRAGATTTVAWSEVTEVRLHGHRLNLIGAANQTGVTLLNPRAAANPVFLALMTDVQQRLDRDRGYRPFG